MRERLRREWAYWRWRAEIWLRKRLGLDLTPCGMAL
jgi:hypothetical protein